VCVCFSRVLLFFLETFVFPWLPKRPGRRKKPKTQKP
jgi:hypothetical protein